ncbi:hypothetical protein EPN96_09135 [bacterium]|nr:MAG: hypothetical protein EPN96_09135 [bacterium]
MLECLKSWVKPYKAAREIARRHWEVYGGFLALVRSPYLHFAVILSSCIWPFWNTKEQGTWHSLTLSVIPNMLGFTLAGYAIMLAFGNESFQKAISGDSAKGPSPFIQVNAAFAHFIMMQIMAVIYAVIGKGLNIYSGPLAWSGFTIFVYSVFTGLAAVLELFRLSYWFNKFNE